VIDVVGHVEVNLMGKGEPLYTQAIITEDTDIPRVDCSSILQCHSHYIEESEICGTVIIREQHGLGYPTRVTGTGIDGYGYG
jgi:hypothetical protein